MPQIQLIDGVLDIAGMPQRQIRTVPTVKQPSDPTVQFLVWSCRARCCARSGAMVCGRARRRLRQCHVHGWFAGEDTIRAVFPPVVARPDMLVILIDMDQKDRYAAVLWTALVQLLDKVVVVPVVQRQMVRCFVLGVWTLFLRPLVYASHVFRACLA